MIQTLFEICLLTNEIKHDFLFRLNIIKNNILSTYGRRKVEIQ
jgi:hypothetical protein